MQQTNLSDGFAEHMGEGVFTISQRDEYGEMHTVTLTMDDINSLREADHRNGGY